MEIIDDLNQTIICSKREFATILVALRYYQFCMYLPEAPKLPGLNDIATDCHEFSALNRNEIDLLCDRINGQDTKY
jgi:hypothetical protein